MGTRTMVGNTDLGEAVEASIAISKHTPQCKMDTIIATMGQGKISEGLHLLLALRHRQVVALHGPKNQMDCHPDHLLRAIRAGKDKAIGTVLRGIMEESDQHLVTVVELEILTFRATPAEVMIIVIGTKDGGAETILIEEKTELIENGQGTEEAKSFEIQDGEEAEAPTETASDIGIPIDGDCISS